MIYEKKIILGTLGGAITMFVIGGLMFGVLLTSVMAEWMKAMGDCIHAEPPMWPMICANLVMGLILSILLLRNGVSTFMGGVSFGLWFFLLLIVWFDLWMFASFKGMSFKLMAMDVVGNTITGVLGCGVISWIYGKVK